MASASFSIELLKQRGGDLKTAVSDQLRQAMAWQRVEKVDDVKQPFPPDAPHTQIVPELEPLPNEAISDKIAMSAFEGTFLNMALRDLGLVSFAVCGIATEIGIEPTVRHGADLGFVPVIVADACGAGNEDAARHSLELLDHAGDAIITDTGTICALFRQTPAESITTD